MFSKGEIPFIRLLIPLISGILLGYWYGNGMILKSILPLAVFFISLLIFLISKYKVYSIYKLKWLPGLFVQGFLLVTGYGLIVYASQRFDKNHYSFQKAEELAVLITSEPKLANGIVRFETEIRGNYYRGKKHNATGKLLIALKIDSTHQMVFNYGDLLLIPATYESIQPPYNPGEFNYKQYLENKQIYFQSFLTYEQIILLKINSGNPIIGYALLLRKKLVNEFYTYLPDKNAAAFASTLILGYRAELSREIVQAYSKTGTMHILSVSGMHVGIVFMVLSFLLKFMDKTQKLRLSRAILVIAIIWFYALVSGFSAPACRAAVMLSFVVLGKALNKNQSTYNLIGISAFFLLLYNPFFLVDAGFQLSYLAVIGLIYFHPKIYHLVYFKNKILDYTWSYSALSLSAQLATFPISIYYFHQFPVYFLFSNLFIVLPVAFIMYAGITFMFVPFQFVLYYLGLILSWLITLTNNILFYIENWPFSSWGGIWINTFQTILLYLIMICFILKISFKYKHILFPIYALLIVFCTSISIINYNNFNRHEIIFFNVRKHTAMAHLYRGRSVIISDLDASNKLTEWSILPTLQSKGSENEVFFNTSQSFSGRVYFGKQNFYQFANFRILRWNVDFDNLKFIHKIKVDAVFISGNPRVRLQDIKMSIKFSSLIIDANNSDYKVHDWVSAAREMNIPCYVLNKNPAYVIML